MSQTISSINITMAGTNSISFSSPLQQVTFLDSTNQNYLRQMFTSNDGITMVKVGDTGSVVRIPISQLWGVAVAINPALTWPPIDVTDPTSTTATSSFNTISKSPYTASFTMTASAETAVSYSWQVQSSGSTGFTTITPSFTYTGSTTARLFITTSAQVIDLDKYQYRCVAYNPSGQTTSSAATLSVYYIP